MDCVLGTMGGLFPSPFYASAVAVALLPLLCLASILTFWYAAWCAYKVGASKTPWLRIKNNILVSCVVTLFLLHIILTKTALKFFTCTPEFEHDAESYRFLEADTRIQCWTPSHYRWAFGLGGSMLILYSIGIPLLAFMLLRSISAELDSWRPTFGNPDRSHEAAHPTHPIRAYLVSCAAA